MSLVELRREIKKLKSELKDCDKVKKKVKKKKVKKTKKKKSVFKQLLPSYRHSSKLSKGTVRKIIRNRKKILGALGVKDRDLYLERENNQLKRKLIEFKNLKGRELDQQLSDFMVKKYDVVDTGRYGITLTPKESKKVSSIAGKKLLKSSIKTKGKSVPEEKKRSIIKKAVAKVVKLDSDEEKDLSEDDEDPTRRSLARRMRRIDKRLTEEEYYDNLVQDTKERGREVMLSGPDGDLSTVIDRIVLDVLGVGEEGEEEDEERLKEMEDKSERELMKELVEKEDFEETIFHMDSDKEGSGDVDKVDKKTYNKLLREVPLTSVTLGDVIALFIAQSRNVPKNILPQFGEDPGNALDYGTEQGDEPTKDGELVKEEVVEKGPSKEDLAKQEEAVKKSKAKKGNGVTIETLQPLWSSEIDDYANKNFKGYHKTISVDEIQNAPKNSSLIFNTTPSNEDGAHWIALVLRDTGVIEHYDSLARPLSSLFKKHLKMWADKHGITIKRIKSNRVRDQKMDTNSCGYFALNQLERSLPKKDGGKGMSYAKASYFNKFRTDLAEKSIRKGIAKRMDKI